MKNELIDSFDIGVKKKEKEMEDMILRDYIDTFEREQNRNM